MEGRASSIGRRGAGDEASAYLEPLERVWARFYPGEPFEEPKEKEVPVENDFYTRAPRPRPAGVRIGKERAAGEQD